MTKQLVFKGRHESVSAELHQPASAAANGGAVVVAYGSDGLADTANGPWATLIRGHAAALAAQGLTVLIPDYLGVTATPPAAVFDALPRCRKRWQSALTDSVDHVATLPGIDPARVGLLGFSLGGHLCLRVRSRVRVLVTFFAPVLDGIGAAGSLTHAQLHHGTADAVPGTGFANAQTIEQLLKGEGTATELFAYAGAGHGFVGADPANRSAREQSRTRSVAFLRTRLGTRRSA